MVDRKIIWKDIEILKNNVDLQEDVEVDHEFRLVKEAIDLGWFPQGTVKIKILGKLHTTTDHEKMPDQPHLTLFVSPGVGGRKAYLYVDLEHNSKVNLSLPILKEQLPDPGDKFWKKYPICGNINKFELGSGSDDFGEYDRFWPNGSTLTYAYMDGGSATSRTNQRRKIETIISQWISCANIKFEYVENVVDAIIRIAFDDACGSWSYIGQAARLIPNNKPTINFAFISGESADPTELEKGIILHEFGHVLGLSHEHTHGNNLTLRRDAVVEFYSQTRGWSLSEIEERVIRVSDTSNFPEPDSTSIMKYFMPAAMNDENQEILPNTSLSPLDKAFMCINYPPLYQEGGKQSSIDCKRFEDALDTAGVPGIFKANCLQFYIGHKWNELRAEFRTFCTSVWTAKAPPELGQDETSHVLSRTISQDPPALKEGYRGKHNDSPPMQRVTGMSEATSSKVNIGDVLPLPPVNIPVRGEFEIGETCISPGTCLLVENNDSKIATPYSTRQGLFAAMSPAKFDSKRSLPFSPQSGPAPWPLPSKTTTFSQHQPALPLSVPTVSKNDAIDPGEVDAVERESKAPLADSVPLQLSRSFPLKEFPAPILPNDGGPSPMRGASWSNPIDVNVVDSEKHINSDSTMLGHTNKLNNGFVESVHRIIGLGRQENLPASEGAPTVKLNEDVQVHIEKAIKPSIQAVDLPFSNQPTISHDVISIPSQTILAQQGPSALASSEGDDRAIDFQAYSNAIHESRESFIKELIHTLSNFADTTSGQLFALQFPGRFIQKEPYVWDTNGQDKPTAVAEEEFRLVDQLYHIGPIVGTPNGLRLSVVYEQILNNLVPCELESQVTFTKYQSEIRRWLLEEVPTTGWMKDLVLSQRSHEGAGNTRNGSLFSDIISKPPFVIANKISEGNKVSRMELAHALMQEYLAAKHAWELEREEMIKSAQGKGHDTFKKRLAQTTAIRQTQLKAKYTDAIIRGDVHTIKQYLGYLDIKTPADMLQDVKDALHNSLIPSQDGSKYYPVKMQPLDWFRGLSPSFAITDLSFDTDLIWKQICSRSKLLDKLSLRFATLHNPRTGTIDLQDRLNVALESLHQAEVELSENYLTNVAVLAKSCINANDEFVVADFNALVKAMNIPESLLVKIEGRVQNLATARHGVAEASRSLTKAIAEKAIVESSGGSQERAELMVQITSLHQHIEQLTARLRMLRSQNTTSTSEGEAKGQVREPSLADVPLHSLKADPDNIRWQDLTFRHQITSLRGTMKLERGASIPTTDVPLFLTAFQSNAKDAPENSFSNESPPQISVEVGMRATLVTIDRSGWFQPQFFKQSMSFHHIDKNISWSKWPCYINSIHDLSRLDYTDEAVGNLIVNYLNSFLLPAYPVGFVICKDITIKIHMSESDLRSRDIDIENLTATSAGILTFSTKLVDNDNASENAYHLCKLSDGYAIRIPGPQILGYILQFTEVDQTTTMLQKSS